MGRSFANELPVATEPPTEAEVELYQSILREPARDDLREKYAELARRRDDPRARLIELQLSARDLRRQGLSPRYSYLLGDASALVAANPEWTDAAKGVTAWMQRGFVEEIHGDLTTILACIDELVAIAPILHIKVAGAAGRVAELAACPALAQVQSLSFENNGITDADLAALAASPYVENLRWLDLGWNKITDAGVDALAGGRAKSLVCVVVGSNPCTDPTDEPIYFDDTHYGWEPSRRGVALEATHGALPWLHPSVPVWPPPMGVV
ncbi:MAG: leucine-rich repeat domain-containing protein [Kofleriaceae bacterium]